MERKKNFYIKTFGCSMNYADSEKIHRILLQSGMIKVLDPTKADLVILNTCSVRQKWEDKVFGYVKEIKDWWIKNQKDILIGITGCMVRRTGIAQKYIPQAEGRTRPLKIELLSTPEAANNYDDELFWRSKRIDFVFRIEETGYLTKILSMIWQIDIGNDEKWEEYLKIHQAQENPASANVIIQTGCDNFCTFCIVPHTRGREKSRDIADIVAEAREVVANGTKEITLLGQNVNSYGKETKRKLWDETEMKWLSGGITEQRIKAKTPFRELLEQLGEIRHLDRIRFTSSNPHDMTRDILDAHFEIPALCPYLHFALQSWSDRILRAMNRKHTYADFKAQVDYLRGRNPLFSISTDIIVGFPGETEEDFEMTARAMEACAFDFAYIARYSVRPGTLATDRLEDDISAAEKARRWGILNEILEKTVQKRAELMIGRTEEILISGIGKEGQILGRTRNFKEVWLEWSADIGSYVSAKIMAIDGWILHAKQI